ALGTELSRRRAALGGGIRDAAGTLSAIASERAALTETLDRAPNVMRAATRTLARLRTGTLPELEPLLRATRPAIAPLDDFFATLEPTLRDALPVMRRIRGVLPEARAALEPLPGLERKAKPALASTQKALKESLPLVRGLRPYTPDIVAGL